MISVIVPTYRNPKCMDICLESALKGQSGDNEIICIIDGFVDESKNVQEKYKDTVNFLPLPENKGMQYALNLGVWQATSDKILIVNDDNVFPKDWDKILEEDYEPMTILTPNQIEKSPSIFDFVIKDFGTPNTFELDSFVNEEPNHREDLLTKDGGIFPLFLSKKLYMMVGGFDILYPSPFICDWDFFLKCELAGAKNLRSRKLNFYHFGSVATKNGNEADKFNKGEQVAGELYEYKWGFQPFRYPDNSHSPKGDTVRGIKYE